MADKKYLSECARLLKTWRARSGKKASDLDQKLQQMKLTKGRPTNNWERDQGRLTIPLCKAIAEFYGQDWEVLWRAYLERALEPEVLEYFHARIQNAAGGVQIKPQQAGLLKAFDGIEGAYGVDFTKLVMGIVTAQFGHAGRKRSEAAPLADLVDLLSRFGELTPQLQIAAMRQMKGTLDLMSEALIAGRMKVSMAVDDG